NKCLACWRSGVKGTVDLAPSALSSANRAQHLGADFLCARKPTRFSPNLLTATCRSGSVRRAGGTKWGKVGSVRQRVTTSDVPRHLPALGRCQGSGSDSRPVSGTTPQRNRHLQGRRGLPAGLSAPGVGAGAGLAAGLDDAGGGAAARPPDVRPP